MSADYAAALPLVSADEAAEGLTRAAEALSADRVDELEARPDAIVETSRPAGDRGYPLPPWAVELREPRDGTEVLDWLDELREAGDLAAAAAWLEEQRRQLGAAWRQAIGEGLAGDDLRERLTEVREHAAELERLYVAASRPALAANVELDLDRDEWAVLKVTLGYDRELCPELDEDALGRITEAAAVGAHAAYERERVAAALVRTDEERRAALPHLDGNRR